MDGIFLSSVYTLKWVFWIEWVYIIVSFFVYMNFIKFSFCIMKECWYIKVEELLQFYMDPCPPNFGHCFSRLVIASLIAKCLNLIVLCQRLQSELRDFIITCFITVLDNNKYSENSSTFWGAFWNHLKTVIAVHVSSFSQMANQQCSLNFFLPQTIFKLFSVVHRIIFQWLSLDLSGGDFYIGQIWI